MSTFYLFVIRNVSNLSRLNRVFSNLTVLTLILMFNVCFENITLVKLAQDSQDQVTHS